MLPGGKGGVTVAGGPLIPFYVPCSFGEASSDVPSAVTTSGYVWDVTPLLFETPFGSTAPS